MREKILFFSFFIINISTINFFSRVSLPTKNGAMCLDGSPSAIYTYEPDTIDKDSNKLLVVFQWTPNGWCFKQTLSSSLNQCLRFANNDFGSSKNYQTNFLPSGGILSPSAPGAFGNWPKVLIKSCDGGSFLGNRQPISIKTQKIYFRGGKIVEQTINYLNQKGWLINKELIVLTGTFNAGIAALQWSQQFQKNTKGAVKVIADAAYFLNQINNKHNQSIIQERMRSIQKITLQNYILPHSKCTNDNPQDLWKCFFLENLLVSSNLPIFIAQSLYDGFHINQILGYECAQLFDSLSQCPKRQREIIQDYHTQLVSKLKGILSNKKNIGVFGISCVLHQLLGGKYNSDLHEVPMNSGNQLYKVIANWLINNEQIRIDEVDWPYNTPCSRKIKNKQKLIIF